MASKISINALKRMLTDYLITGHDVRAALVMTSTTVDTEINAADVEFMDEFATLDEMDGANYVRKALADEAVAADDVNARSEFDATDLLWTALGAGTRNVQGVLLYEHVTNDADSEPIAYLEFASAYTADGSNFQIQWNAEGILQAKQGT